MSGDLVFYVIGVWQRPGAWLRCWVWRFWCICWGCGWRPRESRGLLVLGLAALFGCLFFFKYAGLLGLGVTLPLAISFYSFQLAAYLIDVYRGRVPAERKPCCFSLACCCFPSCCPAR